MPEYKITSGLPQLPATNDKAFKDLFPLYTAINALAKPIADLTGQVTFSQAELAERNPVASITSQHQNRVFVKALELLPFGALVSLSVDAGKLAGSLASCTVPIKPAHGIVAEPFGIQSGKFGEITMMNGYSPGIAGTAVGQFYWLATGGLVQAPAPTTAGQLLQAVGVGLGSAGFYLQIDPNVRIL